MGKFMQKFLPSVDDDDDDDEYPQNGLEYYSAALIEVNYCSE